MTDTAPATTPADATLLTPKSVEKIRGAQTLFMHITDGVGHVRVNGWAILTFTEDQFPAICRDLRDHGWYARPLKRYSGSDYSMCERYPDPGAAAEEPADGTVDA